MADIVIRRARLSDVAALLDIYRPYVERTAITFEWTVPDVEEFRRRIAEHSLRYPYLVAEREGRPVGYAYVSPFVGREAYDWSVELSIYVDMTARHSGAGGRLYRALEQILAAMNVTNLNACIGVNPPGQAADSYLDANSPEVHAHMGYRLVGRFEKCGRKFGRWYDMIWMEKIIRPHEAHPAPVINFNDLPAEVLERLPLED